MSDGKQESGYPHTLRVELHEALKAAGIDYWVAQGLTFWSCGDGRECVAYGFITSDGTPSIAVKVVGIRDPQQAIGMTVGTGTCKCVDVTPNDWDEDLTMYHMECGFTMLHGEDRPRFCGGCGRRIEQ